MKKRILATLLCIAMVLSMMPLSVFAEGAVCKIGETEYNSFTEALQAVESTKEIVLLADIPVGTYNFLSKVISLDLNGFKLQGVADNATTVTVKNNGTTKKTLAATGTYANDISAFVAEDYAATGTGNTTVYYTIVAKVGEAKFTAFDAAVKAANGVAANDYANEITGYVANINAVDFGTDASKAIADTAELTELGTAAGTAASALATATATDIDTTDVENLGKAITDADAALAEAVANAKTAADTLATKTADYNTAKAAYDDAVAAKADADKAVTKAGEDVAAAQLALDNASDDEKAAKQTALNDAKAAETTAKTEQTTAATAVTTAKGTMDAAETAKTDAQTAKTTADGVVTTKTGERDTAVANAKAYSGLAAAEATVNNIEAKAKDYLDAVKAIKDAIDETAAQKAQQFKEAAEAKAAAEKSSSEADAAYIIAESAFNEAKTAYEADTSDEELEAAYTAAQKTKDDAATEKSKAESAAATATLAYNTADTANTTWAGYASSIAPVYEAVKANYDALKVEVDKFTAAYTNYTAIKALTSTTVTLIQDIVLDGTAYNFNHQTVTVDLNGCFLKGSVINAENVTVANSGTAQATLAAVGTYANNISSFVADGYDVKKYDEQDLKTVYADTVDVFKVKAVTYVTSTAGDRDEKTAASKKTVDVYAGDTVSAEIRVYGARFVASDVTFAFDADKFELLTGRKYNTHNGWEKSGNDYTYRFYSVYAGSTGGYNELTYDATAPEGEQYYYNLGTFSFKAKEQTEAAMNVPFKVKAEGGESFAKSYVVGSWAEGQSTEQAVALKDTQLENGYVNILLRQLSIVVNANTGLVYKGIDQKLLKDGFTAKDNIDQVTVTGATIQYAVVNKGEAAPAASAYTTNSKQPQFTNAGDYVIYYKVEKAGYEPYIGNVAVSIAKRNIDLVWGHDEATTHGDPAENWDAPHLLAKGTKAGTDMGETDFYGDYRDGGYLTTGGANPITATYTGLDNGIESATVTMTTFKGETPADGTKLEDVGLYVFTATVANSNFEINNPTCTVLIDGSKITGYSLANDTTDGTQKYFDKQNHVPSVLVKADDATKDVTIKYYMTNDFGESWGEYDEIPLVSEPGTYTVKAVLSKDKYYDLELSSTTFIIKNVQYKSERVDWVTGWDVVFVYSNENVAFTYDGAYMYNVKSLGYKYEDTNYKYVYAIAVYGNGNTQLITPNNDLSKMKDINNGTQGNYDNRYNVNHSTGSNNGVDILDLVAVQDIYNVGSAYFDMTNHKVVSDDMMAMVLKADVSGNKEVDTTDCSQIKAYKAS